jgi:hypothetical protein
MIPSSFDSTNARIVGIQIASLDKIGCLVHHQALNTKIISQMARRYIRATQLKIVEVIQNNSKQAVVTWLSFTALWQLPDSVKVLISKSPCYSSNCYTS